MRVCAKMTDLAAACSRKAAIWPCPSSRSSCTSWGRKNATCTRGQVGLGSIIGKPAARMLQHQRLKSCAWQLTCRLSCPAQQPSSCNSHSPSVRDSLCMKG